MKLLKAIHNYIGYLILFLTVVAGCKDMKLLKAIHNGDTEGMLPHRVVAGCKDMKLLKAIHNAQPNTDQHVHVVAGRKDTKLLKAIHNRIVLVCARLAQSLKAITTVMIFVLTTPPFGHPFWIQKGC